MPPRKAKPKEFDEAVLQTLTEPISISLWKIVSGKRSDIELPPGPGHTIGGQGYTQDMIRQFSSFVANKWSGGGMYDVAATGANGEQMKWEMFFPPNKIPELTPPTQVSAPVAPQPAPAPQPQYAPPGGGGWLDQIAQTYQQHPAQPPFAGQPASGSAAAVSPYGWQVPQFGPQAQVPYGPTPAPAPGLAATKEREERLKLEAKMERQTQQTQHDKSMAAITQELRRVQEQMSSHPAVEESAALKAASEKIAALEQQNSTQQLMQQMQAMQQNTNQMFERMAANTEKQIEAIRREAQDNKPQTDPMLPMLMQIMQQQGTAQAASMQTFVQAMQSNQTAQMEAARLAQASQMGPREMVDLVRTANAGQDHMAAGYARMQDMWVNSMDSILNSQGPGVHPALAMIGSGVEGGLGIAQQYLEMKQNETQANAQARGIQAQMEAQARVRAAQVQAEAAHGARATEPTEPTDTEASGASEAAETEEAGETEAGESEVEVITTPTQEQIEDKEQQVFGEALPHVMRLRKGVASGAISSVQAAAWVMQAIEQFGRAAAEGKELPPIFSLFQEQRIPELVDALIPDARADFRDEAAAALFSGVETLKAQAGMAASAPPEPQPVA